MKRKYREAMRAAARERDQQLSEAADALQQYEETTRSRNYAKRYPPLPVAPCTGEPWRPVMTEQEREKHEQYVREHNLPF